MEISVTVPVPLTVPLIVIPLPASRTAVVPFTVPVTFSGTPSTKSIPVAAATLLSVATAFAGLVRLSVPVALAVSAAAVIGPVPVISPGLLRALVPASRERVPPAATVAPLSWIAGGAVVRPCGIANPALSPVARRIAPAAVMLAPLASTIGLLDSSVTSPLPLFTAPARLIPP